jgi:hypothetical protein
VRPFSAGGARVACRPAAHLTIKGGHVCSDVLSWLSKWLAIPLLVASLGGHWALLQTAAWVGMTIDYSQRDELTIALKKTFDGKHPCKLCQLISKGKKSERKTDARPLNPKLDLFLSLKAIGFYPPSFPKVTAGFSQLVDRAESPPVPPPRFLQG